MTTYSIEQGTYNPTVKMALLLCITLNKILEELSIFKKIEKILKKGIDKINYVCYISVKKGSSSPVYGRHSANKSPLHTVQIMICITRLSNLGGLVFSSFG